MRLTAWRATLRIARRDAMRAKGRSALVVAMIALPILGVAGVDVVARSAQLEPGEKAARAMGTADARIDAHQRGDIVLQAPNPDDEIQTGGPGPDGKPRQKTAEEKRSADTEPADLVKELLPAGTKLVPTPTGPSTTATTKDGRMTVQVVEADLANPVWHGMLNLVRGTAPAKPNEIAATQEFLNQSGLRLGDATAVRGLESKPFTITAVAEIPADLKRTELIAAPGSVIAPLAQADPERADSRSGRDSWLVQLPAGAAALDWPKVLELNKYGFAVNSRAVLLDPPARSEVPLYQQPGQQSHGGMDKVGIAIAATVVGMALLEIVLLAGPAFAVGARRSRRQLGLLAAGGGDRGHVRAVVLGGGAVLGVTGAVTGLVLAILLVAVFQDNAEQFAGRRFGHFDLQPLDLLAIATVGLVTGLLAAVVPAVQAARQDVVAALTGRGGIKPASRIVAVLGLIMVAGGAALAMACAATGTAVVYGLLGGSVIAEIGMLLCTPMLIGLFGRLGRHLPLSPRLALRDSVRHRGRTAPAVAAVMAAVAGAVAVGIYTTSSTEQQRRDYRPQAPANAVALLAGWGPNADQTRLPLMRDVVESNMPGLGERADVFDLTPTAKCAPGAPCGYARAVQPESKRCPADDARTSEDYERLHNDPRCLANRDRRSFPISMFGDTVVGDAALLHNLFGVHDQAAEKALADGKALVFRSGFVENGKVDVLVEEAFDQKAMDSGVPYQPKSSHVMVDAVEVQAATPFGTVMMTRQAAEKAGLGTREAGSFWLPAAEPSDKAYQKANGSLAKLDDNAFIMVERGFQPDIDLVTVGLMVFAGLVALGAAGIATGLAAADSQQDLATLAAVGASSGIRRRLSGFQCGVIAAMGSVLGLLCGAVPSIALRIFEAQDQARWAAPGQDAPDPVIAIPWAELAAMVIGLPVVAVLLAALLTRSKIALSRRAA
ncbi:FtsX-like permease family protein [Kitasatospora sp. NPDC059795]|uniref:FtsX-like permease family protein n=1 Tax=Kitasatospora sp. NPDC059795 TaxID=3346949 RepID=UPI00364D0584